MSNLIQESRNRLQSQGGRMTAQRRLILETLEDLGGHPTAEDLFEVVNQFDSHIHLSTIYRTLRWLEQEGLVSARRFDEEQRQERFDPALPTEHDHFVCRACNRVIEFNTYQKEAIKSQFQDKTGAVIETISIELYGLCADCWEVNSTS